MDLNLFENLKKDIESNGTIKNFMEELTDFLRETASSSNKHVDITDEEKISTDTNLDKKLEENRKEDNLYLVTEDRNGEIYLWDFTDKPKHEFKETISSEELLGVAKEGTMLQYKNGKYELYSQHGYDMLFDEDNNGKIEK